MTIDIMISEEQSRVDVEQKLTGLGDNSAKRLISIIERLERLEADKKEVMEDAKEVLAEAKSAGYDTKTIKKIIKLRAMDADNRREEEEILELYKAAVGLE